MSDNDIFVGGKTRKYQYILFFYQNKQYFLSLIGVNLDVRELTLNKLRIMSKQIEKLKKQLMEISEVVNSFNSEAVQVRVVDRLLDAIIESDRADADNGEIFSKRPYKTRLTDGVNSPAPMRNKKPGATKILNKLLSTDFFYSPRSISSIASYCQDNFDSDFKTSELSGILLKLAKENKLRRERSEENNRFEYVKA